MSPRGGSFLHRLRTARSPLSSTTTSLLLFVLLAFSLLVSSADPVIKFIDVDCREGFLRGSMKLPRFDDVYNYYFYPANASYHVPEVWAASGPILVHDVSNESSLLVEFDATLDINTMSLDYTFANESISSGGVYVPSGTVHIVAFSTSTGVASKEAPLLATDSSVAPVDQSLPQVSAYPLSISFVDLDQRQGFVSGDAVIRTPKNISYAANYTYSAVWCPNFDFVTEFNSTDNTTITSMDPEWNFENCMAGNNLVTVADPATGVATVVFDGVSVPSATHPFLVAATFNRGCFVVNVDANVDDADQECGDGHTQSAEECDDGNVDARDGCSATCYVEPGWYCLINASSSSSTNRSICHEVCGDELLTDSEDCDVSDTSWCINCSLTAGYSCYPDRYRNSVCSRCGDGRRSGSEGCDDGNTIDGDGCNSGCVVDPGYSCIEDATLTSACTPYAANEIVVTLSLRLQGTGPITIEHPSAAAVAGSKAGDWWDTSETAAMNLRLYGTKSSDDEDQDDDTDTDNDITDTEQPLHRTHFELDGAVSDLAAVVMWAAPAARGVEIRLLRDRIDEYREPWGVDALLRVVVVEDQATLTVGQLTTAIESQAIVTQANSLGGGLAQGTITLDSLLLVTPPVASRPEGKECGDGILSGFEDCDDGNLVSGDGCNARCALEDGWSCFGDVGQQSTCSFGAGNGASNACPVGCNILSGQCVCFDVDTTLNDDGSGSETNSATTINFVSSIALSCTIQATLSYIFT